MKVRAHTLSPSVARGIAVISAAVFATGASTALAAGVVGAGTADSCTDAALVATRLRSGRAGALAVVGSALCTLLAAAPARAVCIGDCNNMCQVVVSNMIVGVNIVLGNAQPGACPAFQNASGNVDVAQLVKGVNNLLSGCNPDSCVEPTETPTVREVATATPTETATSPPTASPTETPTQGPTLTPTETPDHSPSPLACDAITTAALGLPNLKVSTAQTVAAKTNGASPSDSYPEHCRVRGTINERTGSDGKPYAIGFELRMPTDWNGKFFFQGGMGSEGRINPALGTLAFGGPTSNALSQGYAVTTTDGGHTSEVAPPFTGGVLFGLEPQARVDYGYNAVSTLTPLAKRIVNTHYAAPLQRSYFIGCSDGGRQALVAAARIGDQFDGIVAVAPGFNLPKTAIQHAWDTQQFFSVSPGNLAGAFTIAEMNLVGQRILAKCDALDGASDGIVSDLAACQDAFGLATDVPTCAGERDGSCLSAAQKTALQNVMNGPSNSSGEALYSTWPWDAGIASSAPGFESWRAWRLENPFLGGRPVIALDGAALPYIFTTPPVDLTRDPTAAVPALLGFLADYNFDTDAPKIFATSGAYTESAMSFMTPPNLTSLATFRAHGKLLIYHGGADPEYSLNDTIRWYNQLSATNANTPDFARLFVVPGMGHCNGGVATDKFDLLATLENWVEEGIAPDVVVAGVTAGNSDIPADWSASRTRPLCAYPKRALLNAGATDLESASSFSCM